MKKNRWPGYGPMDFTPMSSGIHSTIATLHTRLLTRWVPKWQEAFRDPKGGYYERLGKGFKPVATGQRRLVSQCRQLSIYSDISLRYNNKIRNNIKADFEAVLERYHDPETGLWHFSCDDFGAPLDRTCDLYALTFVIFSFSHYYRATHDPRARDAARQVLDLIDTRFRLARGFAEMLDPQGRVKGDVRRQNPHMHLLEACLFAFETWKDSDYLRVAEEMVTLFKDIFFDPSSGTVIEYFTQDLKPHPDKGGIREPGHAFEWIWLLHKYAALSGAGEDVLTLCEKLLETANRYGWDSEYGGIYDGLAPDGSVLMETKRIWPFCEALKANALMLSNAPDRQSIKDRVAEMVRVFDSKYMQERGFWTEWLTRTLEPETDYMPATTPYHVYFGITETMKVLEARGPSKSWTAGLTLRFYTARRLASSAVRRLRRVLGGG